jgi:hypothetical protein
MAKILSWMNCDCHKRKCENGLVEVVDDKGEKTSSHYV